MLAGRVCRYDAGVHEVDGAPVGHPHDRPASLVFRDSLQVRVSITITPTDGKAQIHTNTLGGQPPPGGSHRLGPRPRRHGTMNGMTTSRISRIAVAGIAALTLATGAVALSGCGDSSSTQTTTGESSTGTAYTRDSTSITAKVGDTFVIQLAMNPSTGYQWQLTPKGDPGVNLKSSEYVSDSQTSTGTETAVGVGGVEKWTFTAEAAGTGTLAFGSIPPGKYKPVETVTFNVTVTS